MTATTTQEQPSGAEIARALTAASHALKSYAYGNGSPDLAKSTAEFVDGILALLSASVQGPAAAVGDREKAREIARIIKRETICTRENPNGGCLSETCLCEQAAQALADREAAAIEATIDRCADFLKRELSADLYADLADELRANGRSGPKGPDREAAARADEREQCAKVAEQRAQDKWKMSYIDCEAIAATIRARQP